VRIPRPDETFIVRVRQHDGGAIVEQPRLARRRIIDEVAEVGAVIQGWLEPAPVIRETTPGGEEGGAGEAP
jgi:hypothetical protein